MDVFIKTKSYQVLFIEENWVKLLLISLAVLLTGRR